MANMSTLYGDFFFDGAVVFGGTVVFPTTTVTAAMIAAAAGIETSKLDHRHLVGVRDAEGVAALTRSETVYIARAAGTVKAIEIAIDTAAVGDATVTVDLYKSTAAGAFATILTAPISITSSTVVRTATGGTLVTAGRALIDGDLLKVVIVSNTAGTEDSAKPKGLTVVVTVDEEAQ